MTKNNLFPPQQDVLDHGILDLGFSSVLSLPTGAGKTTLAEMGMERALLRGERVVYLTPLKSLAEEKINTWQNHWPDRKVGIFTGDYDSSSVPIPYKDAEVLICTYERLDGILRHWQRHLKWLSLLGLIVIDEFHLLIDPGRGPRLEGAITRLRRVNPFCRIMGLSATISNHSELARWLNGVSYHSIWRPVPLHHEIRRFKKLADKPGIIIDIVYETAKKGGQTLVFASSRRRAEQLATKITTMGYPASHHHAGLGLVQRRKTESDFRSGSLVCLVATPTLEMGLNLPCRTVVIADNTRWNGETFEPLPIWNYLQRAGRAGRPGQKGAGKAILLAPSWVRQLPEYGRSPSEPICSQLTSTTHLAEQFLIEVASRSSRTRIQLARSFLPSTLAFQQNPSITKQSINCVDDLLESGMMTENDSNVLKPTRVGWVAVRHQLSPSTTKHLLSLTELSNNHSLTDFDLLLHHCWDYNFQPRLPISIEVIEQLEDLIHTIPSHLLDTIPPLELPPRMCASGVLMATLAWHFVQGLDLSIACEQLDTYLNDAETLQQSLIRLMKASADLHIAIDPVTDPIKRIEREFFCGSSLVQNIHRLTLRLEYGLPDNAVYLTRIPGCGGKMARRLLESGITNLEDLCNQEPSDLIDIPGIGAKRAQAWIDAAENLVKDFDPEQTPCPPFRSRSVSTPPDWPRNIDPGRLQRATSLKVQGKNSTYWVSGGAEEHSVKGGICDCADFIQNQPDWWCKHRLAIQLTNDDRKLKAMTTLLSDLSPPATLAGHLADLTLGRRWQHG